MKKLLLLFLGFLLNNAYAFQNKDYYKSLKVVDSLVLKTSYSQAYDEVLALLKKVSKTENSYHLILSKYFYCQGLLEENNEDYKKAIDFYEKAQDAIKDYKSSAETTYKINIFSRLYHSLAFSGDWKAAQEKGIEGLALIDDSVDKKVITDYIYDLGYINDRLKNYEEAIDLYKQSIKLYKTFEDNKNADLGLAYNNLATVYSKIGFFSERLKSFEQAQYYWEKDKSTRRTWLISLYGNMMKLYIEYGDVAKAKQMFINLNKIPNETLQYNDLFNKLRVNVKYYVFTDQLDKAERQLEEIKTIFLASTQKEQEHVNHHYLAVLHEIVAFYYQKKIDDKALESAVYALNLAKMFKQPYFEMVFYTEQSKVVTAKTEYARAITLLDKALSINDEYPIGLINVVSILIEKGKLQVKLNNITEARKTIERALSLIVEKEVKTPQEITIKAFEQQHDYFFVLGLKNAANSYREMYMKTLEKEDAIHAKHLYEIAAEVFGLYYQKGDYNKKLNRLNKEINEGIYEIHTILKQPLSPSILAKIEDNNSKVLRNEFERKYFQFLSVEDSLWTKRNLLQYQLKNSNENNQKNYQEAITELDSIIAEKAPLFQSFYNEKISLQNIQNYLKKDELIVKYSMGSQHAYAIAISNYDIQLFRLTETDSLKEKLTTFYKNLQNPQKNTLSQAQELYLSLLSPLQNELNKFNKLTIIPDDFLHYLPFEVLVSETTPLVISHDIKYANSLALWIFLMKNPAQTKQHQDLLVAFAPQYEHKEKNASIRSNRFKDIKGAKIEAEKISDVFNGDLFLSEEASVENFINNSSAYKIYHLAMHAILNEEDYSKSSLIFHNNDFFDFSLLYSMYFPADLVVLSACNTGVGELAEGEGLLSLSRALTYSGVRSSVYSLWEVPDEETSEIMVSFYKYLNQGKNKVSALARAKQDFIENNPLKSHPYYWAGFVINGDDTPIVTNNNTPWLIVAGGCFISIMFLFISYRRKANLYS